MAAKTRAVSQAKVSDPRTSAATVMAPFQSEWAGSQTTRPRLALAPGVSTTEWTA